MVTVEGCAVVRVAAGASVAVDSGGSRVTAGTSEQYLRSPITPRQSETEQLGRMCPTVTLQRGQERDETGWGARTIRRELNALPVGQK